MMLGMMLVSMFGDSFKMFRNNPRFLLVDNQILASDVVATHPSCHDVALGAAHGQNVTPIDIVLLDLSSVRICVDFDAAHTSIP